LALVGHLHMHYLKWVFFSCSVIYHHNLDPTPVIVHSYLLPSHSSFFFCGLFYTDIRARLHTVEWYDDRWTINCN
jgi:hypothetical protein